jgi:predicted ATPase/class 3 adenylate cyclase
MSIFLFTDIEGSTTKWEKHREEMGKALSRHDALLQECMQAFGGRVIKHTGDGVFAVFEQGDPLLCALEFQKRLALEGWGEIGELRVRMALHAGEAEKRGGDYFGPVVNRTARLLSAGWGGQVLLSSEAASFCLLPSQATLMDLGTHLLKDLIEPQRIFMLAHPELPLKEFPPLRSLTACPNNLPPQPTPFLGREEELAEIQKLLERPSCRLLTLVGPGGIGKTRLALQAAAEVIEAFPHGVYFVPLAPLSPEDFLVTTIGEFLLTSAVAEALGFTFYGKEDPKAQLLNYLREKELLLLLDGFEHLLPGTVLITDILNGAPKVKALATSRERLSLLGERTVTITGLKIPEDLSGPDCEDYGAVRLFVETARRTDSGFRVRSEERECIGRICRLVEGLPLGIELAAAWVRVLSCREIVHEIEKNRDFLESTLRDAPERHRSLRAVFESSWEHLKVEEKFAYQRLSVFRGGFTREAAEEVARTTLSLLSALLDKSLLRKGPTGRYEILEILRQYAEEKLDAVSVEKEEARDRHSDYYLGFVSEREKALRSARQREALEEIGAEIENLREAWTQAIRQRKLESLTRGLEGLYRFYDIQSWFREGEEAFARASEGLSEASGEAQLLRAKLLSRRSAFAVRLSRYEEARDLARQSLEIFQHAGDRKESAFAQNNLGNIAHNLGDYPEAGKRYEQSLALYREEGDPIKEASVLNNLGIVSSALGEFAAARERFQRSLQIYRGTGDRRGIAAALVNLGSLAFDQGAPGEARPLYQESLEAFRELGDRRGIALALTSLGRVAFALSEAEEAKRLYEEGLALRRGLGDRLGSIHTLVNLGDVSTSLGQTAEARAYLAEASRKTLEIRALPLAADILLAAARLLLKEETPVRADQRTRACQYLALVADHSAATRETRENARTLLADAETSLPSGTDPSFRAGPRTLEEALDELSVSGP